MTRLPRIAAWSAAGIALALAALPAQAVYKVIGPDGKVTYTDTPPPAGTGAQVKPVQAAAGGGPNLNGLPPELRQAAGKFPVVLYATKDCRPCDNGRQLLQQRGIPFAERVVGTTGNDQSALQQLTGSTTLPVLTVGQQRLTGLTASEWHSYLDAAGYPRESKLPASYKAPAPAALVPPADAAPAQPAVEPPAATPPEAPASGPNIRF